MTMLKKYLEWELNILMKYKYKIENLDCANCAKELENHLNKDPNIKNVSCKFSKSTLTKNIKKYVS